MNENEKHLIHCFVIVYGGIFFDCCREYLQCPKSFPLHDAMYYDDVAELKRRLFPSQRLAIQTALSNPYQYLKVLAFSEIRIFCQCRRWQHTSKHE